MSDSDTEAVSSPAVGGLTKGGVPWTGGKRSLGARTGATKAPHPYCGRPDDPDKLIKVYKACKEPLSIKYDGVDNVDYSLSLFASFVQKHLESHGMDSVFYLTDKDGVERNVIEHHPLFTIDEVEKQTRAFSDPFDLQNLKWSEQFLFDSLSMKQQLHVAKHSGSGLNGPLLWMYIVLENQSDTARALRALIQEVENMKLTSYPAEDVKACTRDIESKCRRLEGAGRLPVDIGATICNIFTKCSVEAFRIPFYNKYWMLDQEPNKFSYRELIREADSLYQSLVNSNGWLQKASEEETILNSMMAKVDKIERVLHQQGGRNRGGGRGGRGRNRDGGRGRGGRGDKDSNKDLSEVECYKCHEKGHYARNCPLLRARVCDQCDTEPGGCIPLFPARPSLF